MTAGGAMKIVTSADEAIKAYCYGYDIVRQPSNKPQKP